MKLYKIVSGNTYACKSRLPLNTLMIYLYVQYVCMTDDYMEHLIKLI